jgi:hypothetical protein
VPSNFDEPPLVTAVTFIPPAPYSGLKFDLWTLTSCTMSLFNDTITPLLLPMSIKAEPSRLTWLFDERIPFTV